MSAQADSMSKPPVKTPAYAWVVLFALYMATLAAPLNLFKLPPVMTILQKTFDLSMSDSGDLMSIFSIMGFVLAIPAGFILKRFGIKLTGLVSVASVTVGSALGAIAETSRMLFVGRFIEGKAALQISLAHCWKAHSSSNTKFAVNERPEFCEAGKD